MYFILFIPVIFISFYIPGSVFLKYLKIYSEPLKLVLSLVVGIVLWGFQGYILGYLNLRIGTYLYCVIAVVFFILNYKKYIEELKEIAGCFNKKIIIPGIFILVGVICQMLPIFGSGMKYSDGIKFFGNNAADGVMHLAYIRSIADHFPPLEPGFSGLLIHNYHYWGDLVEADIARIWSFPIIHLFFQFFPVLLSILIGIVSFLLVREWGGSRKMALWFLFLLYFASDAAYLVLFALRKPFGFYTPAIDSGVTQFLNMPHMFGKLVFLSALIAIHKWLKTKKYGWGVVTVLLCASLFGFKIYFGLYIAIGLFSLFFGKLFYETYKKKRLAFDGQFLLLLASFLLFSLAIFLPHNYGAGGFVFVYLEWPRSLLGSGSIDWREWWLRRQVYEDAHNVRNLIVFDSLAVLIALISIYGTRLLGFVTTKKLFKFLGIEKTLLLIPALILFHVLGLFTIQSSGGVNVYNFFSVSAVILSLFAAFILSTFTKKLVGMTIIIIFIVLTVPRSMYEISSNISKYGSSDFSLVSNEQLDAFRYIRNNTNVNSLVQASPNNSLDNTAPYVSFFSGRDSYIAGSGLLKTHNVKTEVRNDELDKIFRTVNVTDFTSQLRQKNILYVYLQKNPEQMIQFKIDPTYIKTIYENKSVIVLGLTKL
jgi:hypothetical protein